jgi:hypothetical protein
VVTVGGDGAISLRLLRSPSVLIVVEVVVVVVEHEGSEQSTVVALVMVVAVNVQAERRKRGSQEMKSGMDLTTHRTQACSSTH